MLLLHDSTKKVRLLWRAHADIERPLLNRTGRRGKSGFDPHRKMVDFVIFAGLEHRVSLYYVTRDKFRIFGNFAKTRHDSGVRITFDKGFHFIIDLNTISGDGTGLDECYTALRMCALSNIKQINNVYQN